MSESFKYGTVGGAGGNPGPYPELSSADPHLITFIKLFTEAAVGYCQI